jgi:RHS repeat-associated protein
VSRKRYRYTGMERDEETGLQCHGVRYYAPWLGRWTSADPIGLGDGVNRFGYCHGNPVGGRDESGMADGDPDYINVADSKAGPDASEDQVRAAFGRAGYTYDADVHPTWDASTHRWNAGNTLHKIGSGAPEEPTASPDEAGKQFAEGAAVGLAKGVAIAGALGLVFGLSTPLGWAAVGTLLLFGAADAYFNRDAIAASAGRLASGEGTKEDWYAGGEVVGGLLSLRYGGPEAFKAGRATTAPLSQGASLNGNGWRELDPPKLPKPQPPKGAPTEAAVGAGNVPLLKNVLLGTAPLDALTAAQREAAAQFYLEVAGRTRGPQAADLAEFNRARAAYLRGESSKPPGDFPEWKKGR